MTKGSDFSKYEVYFPPPMMLCLAVARFTVVTVQIWGLGVTASNSNRPGSELW